MTSAESEHENIDPLRLDRCPECGYLLTGLPERGCCPECGFAYGTEQTVLYGWQVGPRAGLHNAYGPMQAGCRLSLFLLVALLASPYFLATGPLNTLLFSACVAGSIGWMLYRRWAVRQDSPYPVQLRMFPEGIAQRTGFGPLALVPWDRVTLLKVYWRGGDRWEMSAEYANWAFGWTGNHTRAVDFAFQAERIEPILRSLGRYTQAVCVLDMRKAPQSCRLHELEKLCRMRPGADGPTRDASPGHNTEV